MGSGASSWRGLLGLINKGKDEEAEARLVGSMILSGRGAVRRRTPLRALSAADPFLFILAVEQAALRKWLNVGTWPCRRQLAGGPRKVARERCNSQDVVIVFDDN
jgi:hypothetical protein